MKKLFLSIAIALTMASCANSIQEIERTYEDGIKAAQQATSPEELTQITINVRQRLIDGAKGIGGDKPLSQEEMRRYNEAQQRFEKAIENASVRITGRRGQWR